MTTVQVRIDEQTKKSAKKVLDKIGMDMSSAVKVYFKQIVITQGLPFRLLTENGLTLQQEQEILKASEEAKNGINVSGPFEGKGITGHLKELRK
jgi:DNA-damage-inducible protein J